MREHNENWSIIPRRLAGCQSDAARLFINNCCFGLANFRVLTAMPIYEYMCQSCHHVKEAIQKISDDPLVECPACGKPELKKQVTAAAFKLKGGGWYETDFKNSGKSAAKSDGKTDAAAKSGDGDSAASGKSSDASAKSADNP